MILLIENYDGCANNIYQLAGQLNPDIQIVRNDRIGAEEVQRMNPSHIILSGGSVAPEKAGNAMRIVKAFSGRIPIMGICLGYRKSCAGRICFMEFRIRFMQDSIIPKPFWKKTFRKNLMSLPETGTTLPE